MYPCIFHQDVAVQRLHGPAGAFTNMTVRSSSRVWRSVRREVEAIASVLLVFRVGVRLLLLLLVFRCLSGGRYPSSRAGQGTQGDGQSQPLQAEKRGVAEGQAYENHAVTGSCGPVAVTAAVRIPRIT